MANNTTALLYNHPENRTTMADFLIGYPNDVSGGLFVIFTLAAMFIATLVFLMGWGFNRAFAAASGMTWTVSVILLAMGYVDTTVIGITTLLVAVAIILNMGSGRGTVGGTL